jgi:hypothetical protein
MGREYKYNPNNNMSKVSFLGGGSKKELLLKIINREKRSERVSS